MAKPIETLSPTDEAIFRTATLKSLQGAAEDPERIGAEYMPDAALDFTPLAVANAAARKLAATYTTAEVTVANGIKVIQDDLPDVVWTLLDASDITLDANWFGSPRTNASGQLPLSGVKLIDGNVPFSFARYIPAASSDWFTSSTQKYIRLFTGITIPASLMVAGNKISITGRVGGRRDSTGLGTGIALTFQQASMFDFIEANPSTLTDSTMPSVAITDVTTTLEWSGDFHAIYTLTAVTGEPTQLRLVANTDLTDGGKIWSFTTSAYAALGNPTGDAADGAGLGTNFTAGQNLELVIGLRGGANAPNKIHQITIIGGINVWEP
jgi:hypothetical protein